MQFQIGAETLKSFFKANKVKEKTVCMISDSQEAFCFSLQGIDWGGLRREWIELICSSLFEPKGGLFCTFHDKRQALVHPNPNRPSHLKLKYYEFAGKIVGKCLYGNFICRLKLKQFV